MARARIEVPASRWAAAGPLVLVLGYLVLATLVPLIFRPFDPGRLIVFAPAALIAGIWLVVRTRRPALMIDEDGLWLSRRYPVRWEEVRLVWVDEAAFAPPRPRRLRWLTVTTYTLASLDYAHRTGFATTERSSQAVWTDLPAPTLGALLQSVAPASVVVMHGRSRRPYLEKLQAGEEPIPWNSTPR